MASALSWGSSVCGVRVSAEAPVRRVAAAGPLVIEAAHKKGGGSTRNKSDSNAQRLGVKIYGDQPAEPGNIIIRQRGTLWTAGPGTGMGKDHTIYAIEGGMVKFDRSATRARICIVPKVEEVAVAGAPETRRTKKYAKYPPRQSSPPEAEAVVAAR